MRRLRGVAKSLLVKTSHLIGRVAARSHATPHARARGARPRQSWRRTTAPARVPADAPRGAPWHRCRGPTTCGSDPLAEPASCDLRAATYAARSQREAL